MGVQPDLRRSRKTGDDHRPGQLRPVPWPGVGGGGVGVPRGFQQPVHQHYGHSAHPQRRRPGRGGPGGEGIHQQLPEEGCLQEQGGAQGPSLRHLREPPLHRRPAKIGTGRPRPGHHPHLLRVVSEHRRGGGCQGIGQGGWRGLLGNRLQPPRQAGGERGGHDHQGDHRGDGLQDQPVADPALNVGTVLPALHPPASGCGPGPQRPRHGFRQRSEVRQRARPVGVRRQKDTSPAHHPSLRVHGSTSPAHGRAGGQPRVCGGPQGD